MIVPQATEYDLTADELRICELVTQGYLDKQIANAIGVSYDVARQRLRILSQKIGASNRAMVAAWYVRQTEVQR